MPDISAPGRHILSAVEFDVVWRGLGLGPTPVVLALPSPGRTHDERRRIEAGAWAALRRRGQAGPAASEPGLDHLLRLLAAPTVRVELRTWGAATLRVVAAGHGEDGVLARRQDDTVVLEPCSSLAGAVVGALPPGAAGPGRAANVPTAELAAAADRPTGAGLRADLVDRGVVPAEAGLVARMVHGVDRRTQLGALAADRCGVLRRCGVLDVLDGPRGRYLMTRTLGDDGVGWTTVAPVDDRRLRHRVAALIAEAVEAALPADALSRGRRGA